MYALRSCIVFIFFLMIRRPPRSTLDRSSAASDVYKRQEDHADGGLPDRIAGGAVPGVGLRGAGPVFAREEDLSLIHISEPTRPY